MARKAKTRTTAVTAQDLPRRGWPFDLWNDDNAQELLVKAPVERIARLCKVAQGVNNICSTSMSSFNKWKPSRARGPWVLFVQQKCCDWTRAFSISQDMVSLANRLSRLIRGQVIRIGMEDTGGTAIFELWDRGETIQSEEHDGEYLVRRIGAFRSKTRTKWRPEEVVNRAVVDADAYLTPVHLEINDDQIRITGKVDQFDDDPVVGMCIVEFKPTQDEAVRAARSLDETSPTALLFEACFHDDLTAVEEQIAVGADVNWLDETNQTPLCHAKSVRVIRTLLGAGAQPNVEGAQSPLFHFALASALPESSILPQMQLLIQNGIHLEAHTGNVQLKGETALLIVAGMANRDDTVCALLDAGADVNFQAAKYRPRPGVVRGGDTPLMRAAEAGRAKQVHAILEAGARMRLRDANGRTALDRAIATVEANRNNAASTEAWCRNYDVGAPDYPQVIELLRNAMKRKSPKNIR